MAMLIQTVDNVVTNRFEITDAGLGLGRSGDNQVLIDDLAVSGHHARISVSSENDQAIFTISDLGSTNGTFVNEKKIEQQGLHHGDAVRIGWAIFTFFDENEKGLDKTSKIKKSWIPGVYYTKD